VGKITKKAGAKNRVGKCKGTGRKQSMRLKEIEQDKQDYFDALGYYNPII
jgi:hypothetical protein